MLKPLALTAIAIAFAVAAQAQTPAAPASTAKTDKGVTLVDAKGMTLYTFDKDTTPGKSVCNGQCATNWPPLKADAGAKPAAGWSIVTRDDGSMQWAHNGKPLYTWVKDSKPGDITGDGANNGAWHVAMP